METRNAVPASDLIRAGEWIILTECVDGDVQAPADLLAALMSGTGVVAALRANVGLPLYVRSVDWPHARLARHRRGGPVPLIADMRQWKWRGVSDKLMGGDVGYWRNLWNAIKGA